MSSKASKELLAALHEAVGKELLDRIRDGGATGADISNAIKFLKDNGIEADPAVNPTVSSLASSLPSFADDEDGEPGRPH